MGETGNPQQSLSATERAQLVLDPAKNAVFDYFDLHPSASAKLQEVGIDVEKMAVVVYWAGGVLDKQTDAAFSAIESSTQTPIVIVPVLLSAADIRAAGDKIFRDNPDVRSIANDGDTLVVGVIKGAGPRPSAITFGSVRIPIIYEHSDMTELATRQNDANPWTGGARVKNGSQGCSSGFGLKVGSPTNYYILTAGHCALDGATITDGAGNFMGTTTGRNLSIDSTLIDVSLASGYMYDGTWNTTSGAREKVVGTHRIAKNEQVCTSGSYTGTHCGLIVRSTTARWVVGSTNVNGISASPSSTTAIAAGGGDSGGPVLVNTATSRQILATGLISVGDHPVACTGQGTSTCYNYVYFVPIQNAQRGLSVVTG